MFPELIRKHLGSGTAPHQLHRSQRTPVPRTVPKPADTLLWQSTSRVGGGGGVGWGCVCVRGHTVRRLQASFLPGTVNTWLSTPVAACPENILLRTLI